MKKWLKLLFAIINAIKISTQEIFNIISKCQLPDIIEHLFINCEYSEIFWTEVQKWIDSIGFSNYKIDNKIKIPGDRKKK